METTEIKPFSHWGDATAIRSRKKKITLQSATGQTFSSQWRFSHQRDYDATKTRHEFSVVDFFLDRIAVALPHWENGRKPDIERLLKQKSCQIINLLTTDFC
jgi:hypothetical protein